MTTESLHCRGCGKRMHRNRNSLPQGQATCHECRRRANPKRQPIGWREVRCPSCAAWFSTRHAAKLYCGAGCKKPWVKTAAERGGRYGQAWRNLVAQVRKEEDHCWICGLFVDLSVRYPDPMSASVDHVIPVSLGGPQQDRENLRLTHRVCNQRRPRRRHGGGRRKTRC